MKESLSVFIEAARHRGEAMDHVLLYGPPGLGKTTMAGVIANEMGVAMRTTAGPAIERPGDLAAILTNLQKNDILFMDEVHRLSRAVEEVLYPAMEDYALDLIVGKGPSARTLRLALPRFTIIGATTRVAMLSSPLRDRFGVTYRLDFYDAQAVEAIIRRSARILGVSLDDGGAGEIARRSRGTPRVANRLLKRVRDFAQVRAAGAITERVAMEALHMLDVDALGLDEIDRRVLIAIIEKFEAAPWGSKPSRPASPRKRTRSWTSTSPTCCSLASWRAHPGAERPRGAPTITWADSRSGRRETAQPTLL